MMNRCGKLGLMAKPLGLKGEAKKYAANLEKYFGEWAEPAEVYPNDWKDMVAPHPEVSTPYTPYVLGCMAEIAEELAHHEDAANFQKYSDGCNKAYQAMAETGDYSLDTGRQSRLVRPLAIDLLNEKQTPCMYKSGLFRLWRTMDGGWERVSCPHR